MIDRSGEKRSPMTRRDIFKDIHAERHRQDVQWGGADHDDSHRPNDWIAFITKQLGGVCANNDDPSAVRAGMIKAAALCVAAAESAERFANLLERASKELAERKLQHRVREAFEKTGDIEPLPKPTPIPVLDPGDFEELDIKFDEFESEDKRTD